MITKMITPFYNNRSIANELLCAKQCGLASIKALFFIMLFALGLLVNADESFAKGLTWYKGQFGESLMDDIMTKTKPGCRRIGPIDTTAPGPDLIYKLPDGTFEAHEVKCYKDWAGKSAMKTTVKDLPVYIDGQPVYELSEVSVDNWIKKELKNPNSKYSQQDLIDFDNARKNGHVRYVLDEINTTENRLRQSSVTQKGKSDIELFERSSTRLKEFNRIKSPETRKLEKIVKNLENANIKNKQPNIPKYKYTRDVDYAKIAQNEQVESLRKLRNESINKQNKSIRFQSPKLEKYYADHGKNIFSVKGKTVPSKPIKLSTIKGVYTNPNFARTIENATKPVSIAGKAGKSVAMTSKGLKAVGTRAPYISRTVKGGQIVEKGSKLSRVAKAGEIMGDVASFGKVMEVGGMVVGIAGAAVDIGFSAYKIYETNVAYNNYELDPDIYAWKMIVEGIQLRAGICILLCTISPDPFSKIVVWVYVAESIVAAFIDDWLTQIQEQRNRDYCRMLRFADVKTQNRCIAEILRRMALEI